MTFKEKIYKSYQHIIQHKIQLVQNTLNELKESISNETKSTAGDKHETALAMLQIEQENTNQQLKEALQQKALFNKINPTVSTSKIINGSLIKTNKGYLFLSIALGKTIVDGIDVIAISPHSPLGQKIMGLKVNDFTEINGTHYIIESLV
jgi:transcription elongation GreA/GreB family factor